MLPIFRISIRIFEGDAHHIARSLRMAEGDEVTVSDGEGKEYLCRLTRIRDEECECEIISEGIVSFYATDLHNAHYVEVLSQWFAAGNAIAEVQAMISGQR